FILGLVHPDDLPAMLKAIEEQLEGKTAQSGIEYRSRKLSGEYVWLSGIGRVTVRDARGAPVRMTGVIMDVTERKRLEMEQQLLVEAGSVLASSLDCAETLTNVARLVVGSIADLCIVDLEGGAGEPERLAVVHADPARAAACEELAGAPLDRRRFHLARAALE